MGKPTPQELEQTLTEAKFMCERGEDPWYVAKALLNSHYYNGFLREVSHGGHRNTCAMASQKLATPACCGR